MSVFNPNEINDMNAYLSDFIINMKSPTKENTTLPLEEAEWHLTACLNYQLCNANGDRTNMIYDTIFTKIHVINNEISMTDINNSFTEVSKNVSSIYSSYNTDDKQIIFIHSVIDTDECAKGEVDVKTIMGIGNKITHFYFDEWEFNCLDTLFVENRYLWYNAADTLEKYINRNAYEHLNNDYYYVSIDSRSFNYQDYRIPQGIDLFGGPYYNRLYNCGNCPHTAAYISGAQMAYYFDSYLGLLKLNNSDNNNNSNNVYGSLINAVVDTVVMENREHPGELIYHELAGRYGVPIINNDNTPSN